MAAARTITSQRGGGINLPRASSCKITQCLHASRRACGAEIQRRYLSEGKGGPDEYTCICGRYQAAERWESRKSRGVTSRRFVLTHSGETKSVIGARSLALRTRRPCCQHASTHPRKKVSYKSRFQVARFAQHLMGGVNSGKQGGKLV